MEGAELQLKLNENGLVRLTWPAALDPQGVYGYEIFRSVNHGPFGHLTSALTTSHVDEYALAGNKYGYFIRAYDFAGNRSADSDVAEITVTPGFTVPEGHSLALDGTVEAKKGYSA